jgi:predicted permease
MVLNSLFPVLALLALGRALKHYGLTDETFLHRADRLVYFIFFPALLFWKIGGSPPSAPIDWGLFGAAFVAVLVIYLLSLLYIRWRLTDFQAGAFSQSCYRFNTYIGMAIVINAYGAEGARSFGLLVGFIIPVINVLAVSTLIWFSGRSYEPGARLRLTARALISNPLILACLAGLLFSRAGGRLPDFMAAALQLMAAITLPLALLSIGGALTLQTARGYFGPALAAAAFKLIALPLIGFGSLGLFGVQGLSLQIGMLFFALPTSTALYVLSAQLNSDTQLASATIVVSTVLSFISLSWVLIQF